MPTLQLKDYDFQNTAIDDIVAAAKNLLRRPIPGAILLDAPTGAGKTVTAAQAIAQLSEQYSGPLAFIWIAPNTLQEQSRDRLASIYRDNKTLSCLSADELRGAEIEDRSILFLNWSSVNKADNRLRRDETGTETGRTLQELLDTTRAAGRKIVLVVDESHRDVNGEQAQLVVQNIIATDLTLEISATPVLKEYDLRVTILREDVVAAGVIRKQFVINPGLKVSLVIDGLTVRMGDAGSAVVLLDVAMAHRKKLADAFAKSGTKINPLVLVQLPDRGDAPADARESIEDHLQRVHGVSLANGKAAVWLANEKVNLDGLESTDSPVEILFFKQAIAIGWDCPRAHILVSLREMKSPTFTAQVLGRILRQPEHHHYDDPLLDSAYVFTNHHEFTLEKQFEKVMATKLVEAQRDVTFPLPYWREVNTDQRLHLTEAACQTILSLADAYLANVHYRGHVTSTMVSDLAIIDINVVGEERRLTYGGTLVYDLGEEQLEDKLTSLVRGFNTGTAAQLDGRKYVRRALLELAAKVKPAGTDKELREVILHEGNRSCFELLMAAAMRRLAEEFEGKARAHQSELAWKPRNNKVLPWSTSLEGFNKCVYSPVLRDELNGTEEAFARFLDGNPVVAAWLKNGDKGGEHFAIPYDLADGTHLFFPDFLAVLTDGRFGIWDTKGHGLGGTATHAVTVPKAEALAAYRAARLAEGTTVAGGIVVVDERRRWMLNDSDKYHWTDDLAGWKPFGSSL